MPNVIVSSTESGKYKVMVNYLQRGIEYASEKLAEQEASKLRAEIADRYK